MVVRGIPVVVVGVGVELVVGGAVLGAEGTEKDSEIDMM